MIKDIDGSAWIDTRILVPPRLLQAHPGGEFRRRITVVSRTYNWLTVISQWQLWDQQSGSWETITSRKCHMDAATLRRAQYQRLTVPGAVA